MPNPVRIPDDTRSLHAIGEFIMSYQPYQNAFLNALVNRIGLTIITSKMWNNPWSVFKRGFMEFGETVEEIFVNIAKPHKYDPAVAEKQVFKREIPDVRAAFHTMNFQKFYKATIQNDQLRQAFLSWQGITDLIAKIVDSMYTGMEYDEYTVMKYMICREALNGGMYVNANANYATDPNSLIEDTRWLSSQLTFLKPTFNRAGVYNSTSRDDQYVIIDSRVEAQVDVEVLARAYNMDRADFLGHLIIVDSFAEHDNARLAELFADDNTYTPFTQAELTSLAAIQSITVARDWWMVFDNFQNFTQNYNGEGLYWQYWYHTWKTFSASPYANAAVLTSQASSVTGVTISPATANVAQGSMLQLNATVAGTGLIDRAVIWSISGQKASGTHIDGGSGLLRIAADEEAATEITVTAECQGVTGTATITVTEA